MPNHFFRLFTAFLCLLFFAGAQTALAATPPHLVLTEAEWAAPNILHIPFRLSGTLITVRARVDSLEGNFFFDTGASGLVLNSRYFDRRNRRIASAGRGSVTGMIQVVGASSIDTFQLDNLLIANTTADMIDLTHIENTKKIDLVGLIGYAVFRDYEVLFDYAASMLVLIRTDAAGNVLEEIPGWEYKPLGSFPVKISGHIAIVSLEFAEGATIRQFALDSGAEQNLLSVHAGRRFLKANFTIRRRHKLLGASQETIEVVGGALHGARLGEFQLRAMSTLLTDLREINRVYEAEVDGILGYEFLSQRPVSINYRKLQLRFFTPVRP